MAVKWNKDYSAGCWWGTQAERIALTSMNIGDKFTESDTNRKYFYTGTAWMSDESVTSIRSNLVTSELVAEIQTPFAKNTAQNTEKIAIKIDAPSTVVSKYKIAMKNPSIDSAVTVKLYNRRVFNEIGLSIVTGSDGTHIQLSADANPVDDYYNGAIRFRTADADNANVLVERLRIESRGIACFSNTICAPRATINCLGVNAGWSSGGGAYQPLQVKAGLNNSGVWVESCSVDSGFYINMAGTCAVLGQSYRTSGGYGDIIIQTSGNNRMRIKCEGNVEVQTGIISPMFMIERNSPWGDITTGQYLDLNDSGAVGLNAKFHQQFAPYVNSGEGMTWNYARLLVRMTSTVSTFSQAGIGCIRNASYFYGSGWYCFGTHVSISSTMDSAREIGRASCRERV
jgi:limonene-1,2-epoxide hydrolase